jgi:hypothetical protein
MFSLHNEVIDARRPDPGQSAKTIFSFRGNQPGSKWALNPETNVMGYIFNENERILPSAGRSGRNLPPFKAQISKN